MNGAGDSSRPIADRAPVEERVALLEAGLTSVVDTMREFRDTVRTIADRFNLELEKVESKTAGAADRIEGQLRASVSKFSSELEKVEDKTGAAAGRIEAQLDAKIKELSPSRRIQVLAITGTVLALLGIAWNGSQIVADSARRGDLQAVRDVAIENRTELKYLRRDFDALTAVVTVLRTANAAAAMRPASTP